MTVEIWKPTEERRDYLVSSLGRVIGPSGKVLKPLPDKDGYLSVSICLKGGILYKRRIHRLVATAFLDNPDNLPMVNHKDGDRTNNAVTNLEWCTPHYNNEYSLAKQYAFESPDGTVHSVFNLLTFCKEHNLRHGCMSNVWLRRVKTHQGWSRHDQEESLCL